MTNNNCLKISVLIASRGNAEGLRTVIGALDMLKSGAYSIIYIVASDNDDKATHDVATSLCRDGIPVQIYLSERRSSLGSAWNECSHGMADIFALVTDRALCVTPHWDIYLADSYNKDDTRVVWWTTNAGPVIPIVPRKWIEASGQLFTEYFPFWFDDTWVHELSALVHGLPNYMVQASCFVVKKNPVTKRLRDLRFWMDFFIAKRPERIAHAAKIRASLNLPEPDMVPVNQWFESTDKMWDRDWQKWEEVMGDKSEPDESYLTAKKSTEEFMNVRQAG